MKIYIDTSVINGLYADDAPHIQEATKIFFSKFRKHSLSLYISDLVIAEIKQTTDHNKLKLLLKVVSKKKFRQIHVNSEVESLAQIYVEKGIVPQRYSSDASHIALATIYKIPVIVSWNFKHLVKHETRVQVNKVNKELDLFEIDICSPEEVA